MIRSVTFENIPVKLSAVCYGCGRLGGDYDEKRSFALLDRYYAMGGRFLDTAACYGRWTASGLNESERCIGKWLKARQITDIVVASKCCHYAFDNRGVSRVNAAAAEADLEESRRALGLDVIPIYLTHRDDESVDVRRIVDFLAKMVESGRILRFGLSNYKADRVRAALDYLGKDWGEVLAGVENEWSLHEECLAAEAGGEKEAPDGMVSTGRALKNLHRAEKLPLFAFSAAAGGYYAKIEKLPAEGITKTDAAAYEKLSDMAGDGITPAALSIAYLLKSGMPAIPIVAVSDERQMADFEAVSAWREDLSSLSPLD